MSSPSRRNFFMGLLIPFAVAACQGKGAPDIVAQQFMDSYYVNMNLDGAKKLSMGLAQEKLSDQIKLLDGQTITAGTNVPKVTYRVLSSEDGADGEKSYVFEVTPHEEEVGKRKVMVKVRQDNGEWRVSQFVETPQGL